jgi:hypothetical protein
MRATSGARNEMMADFEMCEIVRKVFIRRVEWSGGYGGGKWERKSGSEVSAVSMPG